MSFVLTNDRGEHALNSNPMLIQSPYHLPYFPGLIPKARKLRKNMTPEERKLWYEYLRFFPYRVRRQCPIDYYIIDFYCAWARTAIEIDGSHHSRPDQREADTMRTAQLDQYNIRVIRYTNTKVRQEFQEVCQEIEGILLARITAFRSGE